MRLFTISGVFFASLGIVLCQSTTSSPVNYNFDCHKYIDICKNNAECGEETTCPCRDEYNGFDCSNKADSTLCTADPPVEDPCKNGGTCYKTGLAEPESPTRCLCPFGYYGAECSRSLVEITCQGDSASYSFAFPPEFVGRVFLVHPDTSTLLNGDCLIDPTEENGRKVYNLTVDITDDNSKDIPCKKENLKIVEQPKRTFQGKFKVFYSKLLDTNKDEFWTLNCTHNTEDGEVSIDFQDVELDQDKLNNTGQASEFGPLDLEFTNKDRKAIEKDKPVNVGEDISLDLYPRKNSGYIKVLFTSCTVNNTLTGADARSLKIINKGCPTLPAIVISANQTPITKLVQSADGTSETSRTGVSVSFSVFKFTGNSSQIGITCLARACKVGDTRCDMPTNCAEIMRQPEDDGTGDGDDGGDGGDQGGDGGDQGGDGGDQGDQGGDGGDQGGDGGDQGGDGGTGNKRRKRAAEDEDQQTISKVFRVVGNKQEKENVSTENETEEFIDPVKECLARSEITAVVAVLGAAVCVLLVVCFILACVILRRRGKDISSYDRPVLQPKPDRFQIPRAHVNESYEIM